ncbi:MAG TPA: hypothetical protein VGJ13_11435 [Pseudonocardiaceae bacterium]
MISIRKMASVSAVVAAGLFAAVSPATASVVSEGAPAGVTPSAPVVLPGNAGTVVTLHNSAGAQLYSATGCHGQTCLFVNGKGLRVNYATVTNRGSRSGRANISSTYDGGTWTGPVLYKNQSWRHDYNRIMRNGNKVCGSIAGLDVACVTIHS